MKKFLSILLCVVMALSFVACSKSTSNETSSDTKATTPTSISNKETNTLVVFFSCTGNTAQVASYISDFVGGNMVELTPVKPYTNDDLNYNDSDSRCTKEQKDENARVEFTIDIDSIENYDTIYIGYPIWFGKAPRIIYSFLEAYDFTDKEIIPFCTSVSSEIDDSVTKLKSLQPNAKWQDGKRFTSSTLETDVIEWLK